MRLIPVGLSRPGMKLGRKIYNEEGLVLLAEHAELTGPIIRKLEQHGISRLYVMDSRTEDIVIPDAISEETRQKAMVEIRSHFRRLMMDTAPRKAINAPFFGKAFKQVVSMIVDDLRQNDAAMIFLTELSLTDHYLYKHSMNVSINALLLGIALGYDQAELTALGLGALLHDIGQTQLPAALLHKSEPLEKAELELMRSHTDLGFRLLKDEPNIPLLSAHCALQHHERADGSGYPRSLSGARIHDYAQWIGILDSYDYMTSSRTNREAALLPHQAMEQLFAGTGTLFDPAKVELFRDRVALYPLGIQIKLSSGEAGIVVDLNSQSSQRPIIRILYDSDGTELSQPYEIDLSKRPNLIITAVHPFD